MNQLETLIKRLNKLNINLTFAVSYPWIYLTKVNNNVVREKYHSEHSFVIGYYSQKEKEIELNDLSDIFKTIRKYK